MHWTPRRFSIFRLSMCTSEGELSPGYSSRRAHWSYHIKLITCSGKAFILVTRGLNTEGAFTFFGCSLLEYVRMALSFCLGPAHFRDQFCDLVNSMISLKLDIFKGYQSILFWGSFLRMAVPLSLESSNNSEQSRKLLGVGFSGVSTVKWRSTGPGRRPSQWGKPPILCFDQLQLHVTCCLISNNLGPRYQRRVLIGPANRALRFFWTIYVIFFSVVVFLNSMPFYSGTSPTPSITAACTEIQGSHDLISISVPSKAL